MKVMVIVKATQASEAGVMPSQELLAAMGQFNEELVRAGVLLAAEGLQPSSRGARVRFSGTSRTVIDGPFAETKELIAGYWLWKVASLDEALEWVKRCPNPHLEDGDVEIRPLFEREDFGKILTPECRERDARLWAEVLGLAGPRFEYGSQLRIAGFSDSYTLETRQNIPAQWARFVDQIAKAPERIGDNAYGVCEFQSDCGFSYLSGVAVADGATLPAGWKDVQITARRYAVFSHRDHVSSIAGTIDCIWTKWVPDSGLKTAPAPFFERYTTDFNPHTGLGGMEIWIPLADPVA